MRLSEPHQKHVTLAQRLASQAAPKGRSPTSPLIPLELHLRGLVEGLAVFGGLVHGGALEAEHARHDVAREHLAGVVQFAGGGIEEAAGGGKLSGIRNLSYRRLLKIPGVGHVKAVQIVCLCTLFIRFSAAFYSEKEAFESPEWVAHRYMEELRSERRETVRALYLDVRNRLIAEETVTRGSIDSAPFPVREILSGAFRHDAPRLLLLHNHPSGDPEPSLEDIEATRHIASASALLGISVLDHLIIGDRKYTSLRDLGILT